MTSQKNKGKYNSNSKSNSKSNSNSNSNSKYNSKGNCKAWVPMHDGLIVISGHPKLC